MRLADVKRNYDRLAPIYDWADRWLVQPFAGIGQLRIATVERLQLEPGASVLDIGCGTGLNLPLLVEAVGPSGRVVGLDYSNGMLDQARSRVRERGWTNVELVQGDAAELAGLNGPFDGVLSTWALGIVDDLPSALRRALAVLRPGGRLAVLDLHRTRARGGLRRHLLDPWVHGLLRWSGVDAAEDLDDQALQQKWVEGKAILRAVLEDVREEFNVGDSGFLLSGTAPRAS
ncbi:MAG: methyltransferase domain-containing protein [Alphaproteobacteria bacterium]|nr:methyltransferase domain-containing protein [Alphaproteobacteria bacterium]